VAVSPQDADKLGKSVTLFSRPRVVEKLHSSRLDSICRKCSRLGHVDKACKAERFTCPICTGPHTRAQHRCLNLGCPKQGNLKPIPNCCPSSPAKCINCDQSHQADDPKCPTRLAATEAAGHRRNAPQAPPRPPTPPQGVEDGMDLAHADE
jgi:hypothetical protein